MDKEELQERGLNFAVAACRARSRAEFISKLGTVVEESDETVYWLEYLARSGTIFAGHDDLLDEARELRAIFATSLATARANHARLKQRGPRKRS